MRLETTFHLSFYVALGLACACLAVAETYFQPWMLFCLPVVAAVLILSWQREGHWVLSETAANYVGIGIALFAVAWVLFHAPHSEEELVAVGVPWPAGLLPHLGPLLLLLLVVKLFRPKRLPDFWVLQTVGLMMVTLGCVLAHQAAFGLLLLLYLGGLLWCLALFYAYRERLLLHHVGAGVPLLFPSTGPAAAEPARRLGPLRVLGWLGLIAATALPLFMVLPRWTDEQWVPQKLSSGPAPSSVIRTGIETGMDLTRTGTVELSEEEAFRVAVTEANGRLGAPPTGQLWRVDVLDYYKNGRWMSWGQAQEFHHYLGPRLRVVGPLAAAKNEPPLRVLRLRFELRPSQAGGLALAEPVEFPRVGQQPLVGGEDPKVELFHDLPGTDLVLPLIHARRQVYRYGQELRVPRRSSRLPAEFVDEKYRTYLIEQEVPAPLDDWTRELLGSLPGQPHGAAAFNEEGRLKRAHHAAAAEALCAHLANSGQYGYSLELRRHDHDLDPTADFLLNVRAGHCERYASGLALMLRSLGIPARVVQGYRGGARIEDDAWVVRASDAHSWVQALVPDGERSTWLILDPTPAREARPGPGAALADWLPRGLPETSRLWYRYVLEYNTEAQAFSLRSLGTGLLRALRWLGPYATWTLPGLALFWAVWLIRWRRRTARVVVGAAQHGPPLYARYLALLARHLALTPTSGQTPREFAGVASAALEGDPRAATWADLPVRLVEALYRVRYGGEELSPVEEAHLAGRLTELDRALSIGP